MKEEVEGRLFDLLEQKSFSDLSAEETAFILEHLSEAEYNLQRLVVCEAGSLITEAPVVDILPSGSTRWYQRPIPLYQAIGAVAASIPVIWFLRSTDSNKVSDTSVNPLVVTKVVHDTVLRQIQVVETAVRYMRDTVYWEDENTEPREISNPSREFAPIELSGVFAAGSSTSLQDDQTFIPPTPKSDVLGR